MDSDAAEDSSPMATLLPLASVSQQPYVSELLSFTLDRLHKVPPHLLLLIFRAPSVSEIFCGANYEN